MELFLAPAALPEGPPRYLELEAGAAGHWLALSLSDVRVRRAELRDAGVVVRSEVIADGARWQGLMRVPLREVVAVAGAPPWRGLIAAVLGGGSPDAERCYLTSHPLPGERPDFHQPRRWMMLG